MDTLATLLFELRVAAGLSVAEVADQMSSSRPSVYSWEAGTRRPRPEQMGRLLDLYGASRAERERAWELRAAPRAAA